jgi:hypothetical protein
MRETIYADLEATERMQLHQRLAEKLEAVTADTDEKQKPLDELARHFRGAQIEDKALDYARRAGKRAIESYANDAAVEHLLYAKELSQRRQTPDIEVLELLSEGFVRKGEPARGTEVLSEALTACTTASDRARIRGRLARCHAAQGAMSDCITQGWRALEELGVKQPRTRAGLLLAVVRDLVWLWRKTRFDGRTSDEHARAVSGLYTWLAVGLIAQNKDLMVTAHVAFRAAIFGERAGPCRERAMSRTASGALLGVMGKTKRAKLWLVGAREDAAAHNHLEAQATAGIAFFGIASHPEACSPEQLPQLQTAMQKAKLAGSSMLGTSVGNFALAASRVGAWKETVDAYRATLLFIERFTPSFADDNLVFCNVFPALLHASGSPDEAVALSATVLERAQKRQHGAVEQFVNDMSAESVLATGDLQGAILRLETSLAQASKTRTYAQTREVSRLLPRLYLQANPSDKTAQRKAARVIKKGRRLIKNGYEDKRPLVEMSEAILFEAQGKSTQADASFAQALQTARSTGAHFFVYDILLQRGLMLKKRGDSANARRDIDEARSLAVACADKYVTRLCDEALRGL